MSKLCLGTVQFGLNYGINNKIGQLDESEVAEILDYAGHHGILQLDTAAAYGSAEEVLGRYMRRSGFRDQFEVLTKLPPIAERLSKTNKTVKEYLSESLERLDLDKVYGYYLHSAEDIYDTNVLAQLVQVKREGLASKLGVSVYGIRDAEAALASGVFDIIQMPYNLLDHRVSTSDFQDKLKRYGVELYGRSPFLQGLLLMAPEDLPEHLQHAEEYLEVIRRICSKHDLDQAKLCIQFAVQSDVIDKVLLGVDSLNQMMANVRNCVPDVRYQEAIEEINDKIKDVGEEIIFPYLWGK